MIGEYDSVDQIRPHAEKVLVLLHEHNPAKQAAPEAERVSAGGIILPDTWERKVNDHVSQTKRREKPVTKSVYATIIAVGPGHYDQCKNNECSGGHSDKFIPNELVGCEGLECIVEHALIGDTVIIAGVEHRMCCETDVLMVLEADEAAQ